MKKITKFEKEVKSMIFELAKKYGYKEIGISGTLKPEWYSRQVFGMGLSIKFYNGREL